MPDTPCITFTMNFHSLAFFLFFTCIYVCYWWLNRFGHRARNMFLLTGSLFFYGWWDWRFISLILSSITVTYLLALATERGRSRLWTAISVCFNVAMLVTFKYLDFFSAQFVRVAGLFFPDLSLPVLGIIVPVGVSFFTFQLIGYAVDVYKRRVNAESNYVNFALFVSFFPQLVAGPIEKASSLLPQFKRAAEWRYDDQVQGLRRILWGLLKKVVIADPCGAMVSHYMPSASSSAIAATLTTILFSVQIYCDFSGYCDIAIGAAKCLGIRLCENFRYPYFATDIREFWRRWNMSLMSWFRDYVYIPLGGSRRGNVRTFLNIFTVFLLSGLWHGAKMHFVAWGIYWGILMVAYRIIGTRKTETAVRSYSIPVTLFVTAIGWVLFVSPSIMEAASIIARCALPLAVSAVLATGMIIAWRKFGARLRLMTRWGFAVLAATAVFTSLAYEPASIFVARNYIWAFIAIMFALEWRARRLYFPMERMPQSGWMRYGLYWLCIILVLTSGYSEMPFIYFQF